MKILLKNAKILTLKNKNVIDGEILVEGNKIAQIAQKINVKADRVIDCDSNLLMPGFKNAHTHSGMVFMRGVVKDAPLGIWLNKYVIPLESKLKPSDVYHLSKLAFLEYLESGITGILDMYYYADAIKKACNDFKMRAAVLLTPKNNNLKKVTSLTNNHLVNDVLGFHADYTSSESELKCVSQLAKKLKAPIYTHCSETIEEVKRRKKTSHLTPVEYLNKFKLFNHGGGIFHGIHLSKNDFKILKKHNVYVCTCPSSNLKLSSGVAPIKDFIKNGITVALGTDGASNNSLDMFKEMQLTTLLNKDSLTLKPFDVLKMATVNGARFMNFKNSDVLAKGKFADIIMIDLHAPNMKSNHNIIDNVVNRANKGNVLMTMIDGKVLYYKHKFFLKEDTKKIYQKANQVINRLIKKS